MDFFYFQLGVVGAAFVVGAGVTFFLLARAVGNAVKW